MKTSNNETIADIVDELQGIKGGQHTNGGLSFERWRARCQFADDYANRIAAAHKRELAAKDDERLTIVANYETSIADKDAEIAELQRRLKEAEEFAAEMKESTNSLVRACGHQMILRLQGEGGNDEK